MDKQKLSSFIVPVFVGIALIAYFAYILTCIYPDVLFTAQDRNVFNADTMFFTKSVSRPFGLFQYVGAFLTQTFYHPSLGTGILLAIWTAIVFVGIKAFRLSGISRWLMIVPAACLMASVVDLGYWIYCLIIPGYWFSQSIAYLCFLLLLWAAHSTPSRFRIVWHVMIGFAAFPLFGWFSYMFTICLTLSYIRKDTKPSWIDGVGIVLALIAPLLFRAVLYDGIHINDIYTAGFPVFRTFTNESLRPSIPFFILIGTTMLLAVSGITPAMSQENNKTASRKWLRTAMPHIFGIIVAVASAYGVWHSLFRDDNYILEMQMTQATANDDWQTIIKIAENTDQPSRTMVMLKNIALMNTGELGNRSFELDNSGIEINNPDSLNVNIMQIAAPQIYYNYGKANYAMRWCMGFGVLYGFSPFYLKALARSAAATGENGLVQRYLKQLHSTWFYADWTPSAESPIVKELRTKFTDRLENDENSCERYLMSSFSKSYDTNSPIVSEQSLLYAMIIRDPNRFWAALYAYLSTHKVNRLPLHYEEAYCIFAERCPADFPMKINVSQETITNYRAFLESGNKYASLGMDEESLAEALKTNWGGTYWWFNAFGRSKY